MSVFQKTATACGLALALVLCSSSESRASQSSVVAAVHAADDAWVKAYNAGQLESVVALYDENAVVYAPGMAPLHGRAAIHGQFEKDMADFAKTGLSFALGANPAGGASGDIGWSSGTWMVKDKAGNVVDSGWYFSVSRKVDGKWLYIRDSWNSDKPTPAASAEK
jgi:ketosteroid isomerase-like protein